MATPTITPGGARSQTPPDWQSNTYPRDIQFRANEIAGPSAKYIFRDDRFFSKFTGAAPFSGGPITVLVRMLMPDGQVVINEFHYSVTPDFNTQTKVEDLASGYLLDVTVMGTDNTWQRGEVYFTCGIFRGGPSEFNFAQVLIANYLVGSTPIGWPNAEIQSAMSGMGRNKDTALADPAPGASFAYVSDVGTREKLRSLQFKFAPSVAVANRLLALTLTTVAGVTGTWPVNHTFVAGDTQIITFSATGTDTIEPGNAISVSVPPDLQLGSGNCAPDTLTLVIANEAAADQVSGIVIRTEQWLEGF
jgi:hypothetical protein